VLRDRWPALATTVARSAVHCADAARSLDQIAALDLRHVADAGDTLRIKRLRELPAERQRHLVRYWLRELALPVPRQTRTEQIIAQAMEADEDRYPLIAWPGAEVRRYRDRLYAMPPLPFHDADRQLTWSIRAPLDVPELGICLTVVPVSGDGLSAKRCDGATVTVRFRRGGEICQPAGRPHRKPLKKLFQEHGVPAWLRDRVPLIYLDGQLAAVGDYWICEPCRAAPDEPALRPEIRNIHLRNGGRSGTFSSRPV
jgi:tRNA(Ile)-lysidine synthase